MDFLVLQNQDQSTINSQPSVDKTVNYCTVELAPTAEKCSSKQIKVRRNSADNISCVSETSSLNDGDKPTRYTQQHPQKKHNMSSSSESICVDEECFNKVSVKTEKGRKCALLQDTSQQMVLEYSTKQRENFNQTAPVHNQTDEISKPKFKISDYTESNVKPNHNTNSPTNNTGITVLQYTAFPSILLDSVPNVRPISRSLSSDYPQSNLSHKEKLIEINGTIENHNGETWKPESPVIRSRSPRKLKRELSRDKSTPSSENGFRVLKKSISQPECGTRYKYIKHQPAPNVRVLIEQYNKRVLEHQGKSPSYSIRKTSKDESQCSQSNSSLNVATERESRESSVSSSQTRVQTLNKAKEEFITRSSYISYTPIPPPPPLNSSATTTEHSEQSTDSEGKYFHPNDDTLSTTSADSVNLVLCRTAESCRESRFSRRAPIKRTPPASSEELTPPTTPTSPDTKPTSKSTTNFLNFKLRKSKKKKELASISELCRQSLFLNLDKTSRKSEEEKSPAVSPESCPSSPELKPVPTKSKSSWLHKTIFKQT